MEWSDEKSGSASRAGHITRRTALTGGAAGLAATLIEACGSADNGTTTAQASGGAGSVASIFGAGGGYRFTFVNHLTTSTFFVPTVAGIDDACRLLNCSYDWSGSASGNVSQMASAINTAVSAKVDGIATTLIAPSLADSVSAAITAGIPVVSYNADEPDTSRLAYIGPDQLRGGRQMGQKIRSLIPGGGRIMVFIATPGSADLAPRLAGIQEALKDTDIQVQSQASGAAHAQELTTVDAFIGRNMTSYRGYFGVDAGSTSAVALALKKYDLKGKVAGGGFDLSADTDALLHDGTIQFAIDQQPYLQGFLPTLELFLYRATQGLTGAADVNTGLRFLDARSIAHYYRTKSRYEGTGTAVGVQKNT